MISSSRRSSSALHPPALSPMLLPLLLLSLLPSVVQAGISTFAITSSIQQCAPITFNWTSTQSTASEIAYNVVLIPTSDQNEVLSNISFTATGNRCISFIRIRRALRRARGRSARKAVRERVLDARSRTWRTGREV